MICIIKFNKFRNDKKYIGARDFQKIKKWRPLKKKAPLFWCAKRDLNPHGLPPEPKSGVSANSTIPVYKNDAENSASCGGKRGIRTLERVLAVTRFPIVRLRPAQPSFHDFNILSYPRRIVKNFFQMFSYSFTHLY